MAGIYIHIPFCRKACHFCNFHFSTSLKYKDRMLQAIRKELRDRSKDWQSYTFETIYFGGGTPSVLSADGIKMFLDELSDYYTLSNHLEITLEANPDDLTEEYLKKLRPSPINRLSIGIQSLFDSHLSWMNRSHDAVQSKAVIQNAQDHGFHQLTIDWIYGYPLLSDEQWKEELSYTLEKGITHFSAYALTVEERTALASMIDKGKTPSWEDDLPAQHFNILMDWAENNGFEHYEISNFAKPGHRSRHNSSYWQGHAYLGLGPSAHSYRPATFEGQPFERRWNLANNGLYMKAVEDEQVFHEWEHLSKRDRFHEQLMTSLRLMEGLNLEELRIDFPDFTHDMEASLSAFRQKGWLQIREDRVILTREGKHYADGIAAELFV